MLQIKKIIFVLSHAFFLSIFSPMIYAQNSPQSFPFKNHPLHNNLNSVNEWFILLDYRPLENPVNKKMISQFDLAIFDADHHPDLKNLNNSTTLIAYVSLGEAEQYRAYWSRIKKQPWIIGENPNWPENFYVDVRNLEWKNILIKEVIPNIIAQGFHGIFMDTLDTAEMLEEDFQEQYQGAKKAMIKLVSQIRTKYPDLIIISNNGFAILDEIASYLDGALVEDVYMMIDFEKNIYKKVPHKERKSKERLLIDLKKKYNLPIFTIDYVNQHDKKSIRWCLRLSKKQGFKPYAAEKNLNKIYDQY